MLFMGQPGGSGLAVDLVEFQTTGTMSAVSNQIVVASAGPLQIGDKIIVELGGETGAGVRGTKGVGGTWPALSYANVGAMNADVSKPDNTYAWVLTTGDVYQWDDVGEEWVGADQDYYYVTKVVPKALVAEITNIAGTTLTLDASSVVATTNANVYLDNWPIIDPIVNEAASESITNNTLILPEGEFAFSDFINVYDHNYWMIRGQGKDWTILFSPNGARSMEFRVSQSNGVSLWNFQVKGNARDNGFGLNVTETDVPQGSAYPSGIWFHVCVDCQAVNLKATDVFQKAVGASFCTNVNAYRCDAVMTEGLQYYVQWHFGWSDCIGGRIVDCTLTSPFLLGGWESFRSTGIEFIRPVSVNGPFSMNTSGDWLVEDMNLRFTANSHHGTFDRAWAFLEANANIDPDDPIVQLGGIVRNPTVVVEGYLNASNDLPYGINATISCPNVLVDGGAITYSVPYASPGLDYTAGRGIVADDAAVTVEDLTVVGTTSGATYGNIGSGNILSVFRNCTADRITGGTQVNCTVPAVASRTNKLLDPENFGSGNWGLVSASVSVNAANGPTGTATADKLVEDVGSSQHTIYQGASATAVKHTLSVYLKAAERSWAFVAMEPGGEVGHGSYVNLATGEFGTVCGTITRRASKDAGNGWWRIEIDKVLTAVTWYPLILVADADPGSAIRRVYVGDGLSGIYLWGAKLEAGTPASVYP